MTFWFNGEFCTKRDAVNIADRGFLLGDGVFETILVVNGVPAFLNAHLDRLREATTALRLDAEIDETIVGVISELAARNELTRGLASMRLTVTRGSGPRGLLIPGDKPASPTVLATIAEYHAPIDALPLQLAVSRCVRCESSISSCHKTLNYLDNILARDEAASLGCDDAVMLNSAGRVACISMGNIFLLEGDGIAITPSAGEGALKGIIRGILLEGAAEMDLSIEEGVVERSTLFSAGLFVTNSLLGVRPAFIGDAENPAAPMKDKPLRRLQSWYEGVLADDLKQRAGEI